MPRYRHDYLKFYQLPNSNLFTHRLLFSRKKPLVKSTAPGSLLYYICLRDLFLFAFIFQIYSTKNTKIPCCNLLLFILYGVRSINLLQFIHVRFSNFWRRYPKGIDNPFNTSGCEYLLFVCRCCLCSVAWLYFFFAIHDKFPPCLWIK